MKARRKPQFLNPIQPWRQRCLAAVWHHLQSARTALQVWAQRPLSQLLTLLVLSLTLLLPASLHWGLKNLQHLEKSWQDSLEMAVFITPEQASSVQEALTRLLQPRPDIASWELLSAEQALAEFRSALDLEQALALLPVNPLPAVARIRLLPAKAQAESLDALVQQIQRVSGVEKVRLDLGWFQQLHAWQSLAQKLVSGMMLFFACVMLLTVGNTVKLAIEQRKEEIEILRLVGGTQSYIRRPFLYSGLWLGLGSGLLAWAAIESFVWLLQPPLAELARSYGTRIELLSLDGLEVLVLVALSSLLSVAGAWLTVGRHLYAIDIKQD